MHAVYLQARSVRFWQFTAQFAALGVGVTGPSLTLTTLEAISQADTASALAFVAYKLVVANGLLEKRKGLD